MPERCWFFESDWPEDVEFSVTAAFTVVLVVIQITSLQAINALVLICMTDYIHKSKLHTTTTTTTTNDKHVI